MSVNNGKIPGEVTMLLERFVNGDSAAHEDLLPRVYLELHRIAAARLRGERQNHTLQPTALVHEAYLKLSDCEGLEFPSRREFYALSARIMRNLLTDYARGKETNKRRSNGMVPLDQAIVFSEENTALTVEMDNLLYQLAEVNERQARVVEMKFYANFTEDEIADTLEISAKTVQRDWEKARIWLYRHFAAKN